MQTLCISLKPSIDRDLDAFVGDGWSLGSSWYFTSP
jgi:hypothetical protein